MYPETYVIDRRGKIARKFIGFQQWTRRTCWRISTPSSGKPKNEIQEKI